MNVTPAGTLDGSGVYPRATSRDAQLNSFVVSWVNIALAGGLVACTLIQFPRIIALLSSPEERRAGHILYHSPQMRRVDSVTSTGSSSSRSRYCEGLIVHPSGEKIRSFHPPRRVPGWRCILLPLICLLRKPIRGRVYCGGTILLAVYSATLLFAGLYHAGIFVSPVRAGYVAVSQIPFVVILASKNNVISMLLGCGWDHLNYIHRFSGRLLVLASNLHVIGYVCKWTLLGSFIRHIRQPRYLWGTVAIASIDLLFFFSLSSWRQRAYNIFYLTHVVLFVLFSVAVCLHMHATLPYVLIGVGVYTIDVLLRSVKTRICVAQYQSMPELCVTYLQVPMLNAGWRAGQHVRLRVLTLQMGWFTWTESHPFTIASASRSTAQSGLTILCKDTGGWTHQLSSLARLHAMRGDGNCCVRVMVEGPYGGPGNTLMSSFSGALLIVGGSGISYALAVVEELLQRAAEGVSSVTLISLIWCIRYSDALYPILPMLSSLLLQAAGTSTTLQITVFYARIGMASRPFKFDLPDGLILERGRPSIPVRVVEFITCTRDASIPPGCGDKPRGVIVAVCGPAGLGEDVRCAVGDIELELYRAVGGVELHEEIYSL